MAGLGDSELLIKQEAAPTRGLLFSSSEDPSPHAALAMQHRVGMQDRLTDARTRADRLPAYC
jgi:hypothetical protein